MSWNIRVKYNPKNDSVVRQETAYNHTALENILTHTTICHNPEMIATVPRNPRY